MVFASAYIYHFDTSDQRKPQGYISHISLTTTAFDAEAAQFPLIIYIEMLKVLHCGFELELLKVFHCGFELNMLI